VGDAAVGYHVPPSIGEDERAIYDNRIDIHDDPNAKIRCQANNDGGYISIFTADAAGQRLTLDVSHWQALDLIEKLQGSVQRFTATPTFTVSG
jgi:hypothetical protein